MIERVDIAVRLVACGASLLLLVLLLSGEVRRGLKLPLAGLLTGSIGYLANSTATFLFGSPTSLPLGDFLSIFTPFFTWLFALRVLEREPPRVVVWMPLAVLVTGWMIGYFIGPDTKIGFTVIHITGLALVADLFRAALLEREDDLVEQRRAFRLWLPLLVAAQTGGILGYELVTGRGSAMGGDPVAQLVNAVLILAVTLVAGKALLRTEPELLLRAEPRAAQPDSKEQPPAPALSPSEMVLRDKLETAMAQGIYRTPGLSISGLAERLGTPEHRLRALINQRLGHRNFSAYLNRYRIAEARAWLADREKVDLPVLTLAMDLGYNSLPPFNRAFREETGTTPSEYRRRCFGKSDDRN